MTKYQIWDQKSNWDFQIKKSVSNGNGGQVALGPLGDLGIYNVTVDAPCIQDSVTISYPSQYSYSPQYLYSQIQYPQQTITSNYNRDWYYNYWYNNVVTGGLGHVSPLPPETKEQLAARTKMYQEKEAKRKAAEQRAEHLLFSILTPAQVKQYTDDQYFDVPIIDRVYRIKRGVSRNIEVIEGGKRTALLCAHPSDAHYVPIPDVMLSQLLALQANEQEFLRIANRTVLQ